MTGDLGETKVDAAGMVIEIVDGSLMRGETEVVGIVDVKEISGTGC